MQLSLRLTTNKHFQLPPTPPNFEVWTEGDSLMNGAYGVALKTYLANLIPTKNFVNTAVGSSTMQEIHDRIVSAANVANRPRTLIVWDGSQNGITTVTAYADLLADALGRLQHQNFIVIPPINPFGETYAGSVQEAIATEFQARWPSNFLHWNGLLTNTAGAIDIGEFSPSAPGDAYHIGESGAAHMAVGIRDFMLGKGWIAGDEADPILAAGSMWLFDPGLPEGAFVGVPAHQSVKPNVAWEYAAEVLGSGDATTLGTYCYLISTNGGADILAERTAQDALHVIMSQDSAYVGGTNQGYIIEPNAAIQHYLDDHVEDDWFFSIWFKVTRAPINPPGGTPATNSAKQSPFHKAESTNVYLFNRQDIGLAPVGLGSLNLPSLQTYAQVTLGAPLLRNNGTTAYTGTKPALVNDGLAVSEKGLHAVLGSMDAWSFFNNGAAPSLILYRAYAESLTVSGRTYDQASAIDDILFKAAFGVGGRFAGDSYTDPATFP